MYSGTTFGKRSGNLVGAHQRIDRIARRHLQPLLGEGVAFPTASAILHFEGDKGPDGVKRKSPSVDEPWHYIDPSKDHDTSLIDMIQDHIQNLAHALRSGNTERASFEAAWAAHAIVDGLTPAHHFPLADKIEELFGMPHQDRVTIKQKNVIKGANRRDTLSKNWEYWGSGGIFTSHILFEWGVVSTMVGKRYLSTVTQHDLKDVKKRGYDVVFNEALERIVALDVYKLFCKVGWNIKVGRLVHRQLVPEIIRAVVLAWYAAAEQSKELA